MLGELVHNEGVIAGLRACGVTSIAGLEEAEAGTAVVFRAHGVTPTVRAAATARGLTVVDGTCSWVSATARQLAALHDEGYLIVLLGTPGHPEVTGLLGFAPEAIVVDQEADWARIPRHRRMALLTQSTQPAEKFDRLAAYLVDRAHELKVINSVCPVTMQRQADTLALARAVDTLVVVGGRQSANTRELVRLGERAGVPTIAVERADELDIAALFVLGTARVVGVSGGTSTPLADLGAVAERVLILAGTPATREQAHLLAVRAMATAARAIERPDRAAAPAAVPAEKSAWPASSPVVALSARMA
jgi:4-hydroxy-3-methylbut-2-enyl diphosphate reductase